ncbi:MAG: ShlB/FhaC/HecB family hemolysin secretion/activation protein [bacterium]
MSLLTLSPESTRLRRVARAHAAGEISLLEYREARRQVIRKFTRMNEGQPVQGSDDTVPRFDLETTLRRSEAYADSVQTVQRPPWLMWLLLLIAVLVALVLPLISYAALIPPVSERDPNPATAPTYAIEQVRWQIPADLQAQYGAAAESLLASGLQALKNNDAPQDHGFSSSELTEVARFLNAIGVHDESVTLSRGDLQDLKALVAAQKKKRGVSLLQLEQLAESLQDWLREQGFVLATAYIPTQEVKDASVRIEVAFGQLSSIRVTNQDTARLHAGFTNLLGKRIEKQAIETRLNTLNRQLGVQSEVYFQPGAEVGESEMVLQVKQQRKFVGGLGLDNYGIDELGQERLSLSGRWNNPRGAGDVLTAKAFTTLDNSAHQFLQLGYAAPVLGGRFDAAAHLSYADLQLDNGSALAGDGLLMDAQLTDTRLFTRSQRRELTYSVGLHNFSWDDLIDQRALFVASALEGHQLWDEQKIAAQGSLQALVGNIDNSRPGQDDFYWRLGGDLNAWMPLPFASDWFGDAQPKWVVDVQWQLSQMELPSTLRLNAAGPHASKGFAQGQVLLDQGVYISSALRLDAPVGQWWTFWDAVYGEQQGAAQSWAHLSSAGLGWEGQLLQTAYGALSSRLTVAYPLTHKGSNGVENNGTQFYWSLRFVH